MSFEDVANRLKTQFNTPSASSDTSGTGQKGGNFAEAMRRFFTGESEDKSNQAQQPEYNLAYQQEQPINQFGANDAVVSDEISSYEQELNDRITKQQKSKQKALDYVSGKEPEEENEINNTATSKVNAGFNAKNIANNVKNTFGNIEENTANLSNSLVGEEYPVYTLSGKELAKDDAAGIAASKFLKANDFDFGDNWGDFQLYGNYDQWKKAFEDESLAPYLTDITQDERFLLDGLFDYDTYWDYTRNLNPFAMGEMGYDDWRLLNGTSAGAMNSLSNALVGGGYSPEMSEEYMAKIGGFEPDENGVLRDEYGNQLSEIDENGNISYYIDPTELAAILNASAMSYGARNGRSIEDWSNDEIRFLNQMEVNPKAYEPRRGNPWGVNYRMFADPEFDYFEGENPYYFDFARGTHGRPDNIPNKVANYYGYVLDDDPAFRNEETHSKEDSNSSLYKSE